MELVIKLTILSFPLGKYWRVLPRPEPKKQEFLQQNVIVSKWGAGQWTVPFSSPKNAQEIWNCTEDYWKLEKKWLEINVHKRGRFRNQDHLDNPCGPLGGRLLARITSQYWHVHERAWVNSLLWPFQLVLWARRDLLCGVSINSLTDEWLSYLLPFIQY